MPFTQNTSPTFPKQPMNGHVEILPATGTGVVTVYTAGANGSKVTSLIATSTDAVNHNLTIYITNTAVNYQLGTVLVTANSGNNGTVPTVDLLGGIAGLAHDSDGNPYIHLQSGDTLTANSTTAVGTGTIITVSTPSAADF